MSAKKKRNKGGRCQKGYKTHPKRKTKKMFGRKYRNCVKAEGKTKDCFDNKTFKGKAKCVSRKKDISKKRANAYVAKVVRSKGEIDERKKKTRP